MSGMQNLYWHQVFSAAVAAGLSIEKAMRMAFDAVAQAAMPPLLDD